jgi:uncharacterized protein (DUF58 family)
LIDALARLLRGGAARARPADGDELFDEAFQRRLDVLALVSRRTFAGKHRAERRTKKAGAGIELADHRDYVPGDDFRQLDWNAYQRLGRLLVRLYEEEEDLSIYLVVDASASMGFGRGAKLRHAKRVAAALAYCGLANLDRVTVVTTNDHVEARLPATRGKGRIFRILEFLRGVQPGGATDLGEAMRAFVAQHKRRGVVVLVSDLYDPAGFERGIDVLRFHRFEPYVIHVVDREEATPDAVGDVRVVDCETGESRDVTLTPALRERVRAAWGAHRSDSSRSASTPGVASVTRALSAWASCSRSCASCASYCASSELETALSFDCRLTRAWFWIVFAREAKWSVVMVSSATAPRGLTHAIIAVRQLPPSESCRRRVSFESR